MGNGAVFQLVPQRFGGDVGLMTGLVGMTGGVGGFYLAASLGYAKQFTGSYAVGFVRVRGSSLRGLGRDRGGAAALAAGCRRARRRARLRGPAMNMIADPREHLVVIGNGMAGMRTVEELLSPRPAHRYRITVFGAEPHVNYNRIMLSSVLAGDKSVDDIVINPREWYDDNGIRLFAGDAVTRDRPRREDRHRRERPHVPYDRLLLATGSRPLAPPIPGLGLPGVCAFRDIADVDKMLAAARTHKRAVVIGGGLLGLEAAWGLKQRGMSVALVHLMPTLMERQLDAAAGQLLQRDLDRRGIAFFTDGQTEEILGVERAEGVQLADGRSIPADLVVLAIGIRPNIDLARAAGLDVNRGIAVYDDMRTSDPDIFAVGECVEHRGQVFGLVAPLWDQAKVCAAQLAGDETAAFAARALSTSLKITGVDVFSAGALMAADEGDDEITLRDDSRGPLQEDRPARRQAGRRRALRRGRRRAMVPATDARRDGCERAARTSRLRPRLRRGGKQRTGGAGFRRHAGRCPDLRLQRRVQGRHRRRHSGQETVLARGGARPHQGVGLMRPMHRPGRGVCSPSRRASTPSRPRRRCANAPTPATTRSARRSWRRS